jgi:UDP-3-O-[3-hydroxymyristoyl] glucosamine N-acyltransferase
MASLYYTLQQLADKLGGEVVGDPETRIARVATLAGADREAIAFFHRADYAAELRATQAGAVVLGPAHAGATALARIVHANPYLYFARVAALLNPPPPVPPGVHPSAAVDPTAQIDPSASIGAQVSIGSRARVGARAVIGPGCVLGEGAQVGPDCTIHPRVVLYDGVRVGARCIIHSGAVLGADGFGFAPDGERWEKIPQVGAVIIGDDVELGANVTVDRGAIEDTIIEEGAKIDNQVQIGHNCRIGAHTVIAGCTGIAGSTVVGRHCIIGGASSLSGHITIAAGTVIAGGTAITRSISQADTYVGVFPFSRRSEWLRNSARLRHLDDLARRVRALERAGGSGSA